MASTLGAIFYAHTIINKYQQACPLFTFQIDIENNSLLMLIFISLSKIRAQQMLNRIRDALANEKNQPSCRSRRYAR